MRLYDYAASANCYKVRLLLAMLGRPHERVPIDIFGGDTLTDEYARINPFRSTPALEIAPGDNLVESNAILYYLAAGTAFLPEGARERAEIVRWLIYEQTDVMPAVGGLRFRLLTGRFTADQPEAIRRRELGHEVLGILDAHLASRDFLVANRFSVADVAVFAYTHVASGAGFEMHRWPAVTGWFRRIEAQPGYMNDLARYPPNARPGAGRSIYD